MRVRLRPSVDALIARLPSEGPVAVVRDGDKTVIALEPSSTVQGTAEDALAELDAMSDGWWAGFIAYDLGRAIERVPEGNAPLPLPDVAFARFDTRIVVEPNGDYTVHGNGAAVERLLEGDGPEAPVPRVDDWSTSLDEPEYTSAIHAIHERLVAGDCYQVNLTRTLRSATPVDAVALFRALRLDNPAPHEALVRVGDVAVVSASPECFLRVDGRRVVTRPIKGTSSDPAALARSAKDRSENVMIVDLARNDLGRVCEYGSVKVAELCAVEQHPGLYHLVSTVQGTLRPDVSTSQLIRATFPPASVTGCPKPRVLQIIEELEPVRRGVYCGAVGFIDADRGVVDLNVAIRTFTITPRGTTFGVGGGIVADSDPRAEWDETELKARRLLRIAAGSGSADGRPSD